MYILHCTYTTYVNRTSVRSTGIWYLESLILSQSRLVVTLWRSNPKKALYPQAVASMADHELTVQQVRGCRSKFTIISLVVDYFIFQVHLTISIYNQRARTTRFPSAQPYLSHISNVVHYQKGDNDRKIASSLIRDLISFMSTFGNLMHVRDLNE